MVKPGDSRYDPNGYAGDRATAKSPGVYKLVHRVGNPFDTDTQLIQRDWLPSEYHGRAQIAPEMTYEDAVAALQTINRDAADKPHATQIIKKALREQGYDGITHIGGGRFIGTNSARHRVIVAFDPNQVRSITAEFDETRKGEPDLMFAASGGRGYGLNPDFVTEGEAVFAEVEAEIARMAPGVKVRFEDLPPGVEGAHSRSLAAIFIALRASDPRAIGDHEVIHAARAMNLIDEAEWRTLKQAALEHDWIGKHDVAETYERVIRERGLSEPEALDFMIEEAVAHEFAAWRKASRPADTAIGRIFQRLAEFIDRIAKALKLSRIEAFEQVFRAVEQGPEARNAERERLQQQARDDTVRRMREDYPELSTEEAEAAFAKVAEQLPGDAQFALAGRPTPASTVGRIYEELIDGYAGLEPEARRYLGNRARGYFERKAGAIGARLQVTRMTWQDSFLPLRRLQEAQERQGVTLPDDMQPYLREELYHSRLQARIEDFEERHVEPLKRAIAASGLDLAQIELYLYARHALERNKQIASINPAMPDGGSGMTDADARTILRGVQASGRQADYDRIGRLLDAINDDKLNQRVAYTPLLLNLAKQENLLRKPHYTDKDRSGINTNADALALFDNGKITCSS